MGMWRSSGECRRCREAFLIRVHVDIYMHSNMYTRAYMCVWEVACVCV